MQDREEQFYWILKAQQQIWPGLAHVHIWDYARSVRAGSPSLVSCDDLS